jgi:hypothetical protein
MSLSIPNIYLKNLCTFKSPDAQADIAMSSLLRFSCQINKTSRHRPDAGKCGVSQEFVKNERDYYRGHLFYMDCASTIQIRNLWVYVIPTGSLFQSASFIDEHKSVSYACIVV